MTDPIGAVGPLRIAALVKQIPAFEEMQLGPDGRLEREGVPLEMSAYCRRAVAQGVALAAQTGGACTVVTLGPPSAEAVLREALAYGADHGVLISDPAFAGSDTLATARALAAALDVVGPFDLVLCGRNSVDAETGQVGPELAQLLDLPFATGVRQLALDPPGSVRVGCEQDDAWLEATVALPAVLSTAERLIDPCKVKDLELLAAVDAGRIRLLRADDLGAGPWGQAASPTRVGAVRVETTTRLRVRLDGPVADQVATVMAALAGHGLLTPPNPAAELERHLAPVPTSSATGSVPVVAVLVEPGRQRGLRELLGAAAGLAESLSGRVVAVGPTLLAPDPWSPALARVLSSWGADEVVLLDPADLGPGGVGPPTSMVEEDVAAAAAEWCRGADPTIVLAPSTAWGARWRPGWRPPSTPASPATRSGWSSTRPAAWWPGSRPSAGRWWPPSRPPRPSSWPRCVRGCWACTHPGRRPSWP